MNMTAVIVGSVLALSAAGLGASFERENDNPAQPRNLVQVPGIEYRPVAPAEKTPLTATRLASSDNTSDVSNSIEANVLFSLMPVSLDTEFLSEHEDYIEYYSDIEAWAINDPYNAMIWLTNVASIRQRQALELLILHTLLPIDPAVVYDFRDSLLQTESRVVVDRAFAREQALVDASSAFEWALQLDNDLSVSAALMVVASEWVESDHYALLARIELLAAPELKNEMIRTLSYPIASKLVSADPAEALLWTETLSHEQKRFALTAVFSHWVEENKDDARLWLQQQPESEAKHSMVEKDFWFSLEHDLDYAISVYPEIEAAGNYVDDHVYSLTATLVQQRPDEVESFVAGLADGHLSNVAKRAQRDLLVFSDPDQYLAVYDSLEGEESINHLVGILSTLRYREPVLVQQWLASSPVSTDVLELAQKRIDEGYPGC